MLGSMLLHGMVVMGLCGAGWWPVGVLWGGVWLWTWAEQSGKDRG